ARARDRAREPARRDRLPAIGDRAPRLRGTLAALWTDQLRPARHGHGGPAAGWHGGGGHRARAADRDRSAARVAVPLRADGGTQPRHPCRADHVWLQGRGLVRRADARRRAPGEGGRGRGGRQDLGRRGTHANVPPEVEAQVMEGLGLTADPAATQVVSRDRHAELLCALAILGGTLERIATEVRHLQRSEVAEIFEPFAEGQQASSAMPHKLNPVLAERITGLARPLRADALVALENMALWHERDISHSSTERFIFERALGVAAYATRTLGDVMDGLEVDTARMEANLELSGG